ncbi:MAG: CRISPR-associated protein Csx3 [Candidatus Saccharicenans sp.]|nr:CRISPR-associated protein Csx3 [Candidatus Saccharicenans sp.]
MKITIDVSSLYQDRAKISDCEKYIEKALELAGEGNEVVIKGAAPIWLYLKIAHALHGRAKKLSYSSPVTGELIIFNHDPF